MTHEQLRDSRSLPIFIHSEIDDLPLSSKAFRVYAHLARRAGSNNTAWPTYQSIGDHCFCKDSDSERTRRNWAMAYVSELVEAGLVHKETRRTDKGYTSNLYSLVDPSPSTGTTEVPPQGPPLVPPQGLKGTPIEGTPLKGGSAEDFAWAQLQEHYSVMPTHSRNSQRQHELWLADHADLVEAYGRDAYSTALAQAEKDAYLDGRNAEHLERIIKRGVQEQATAQQNGWNFG